MIVLKKQKWELLAENFNRKFNSLRQSEQLIQKWRSMKKAAKKLSAIISK